MAVTLAETSAEELAPLWPVDPAIAENMVAANRAQLQADTPDAFFDELDGDDRTFVWGVYAQTESGLALAGITTLYPIGTDELWQDVGIALLRPEMQGRGLGFLATAGVVAYAFEQTDAVRLYADPLARNTAMQRVLYKLGFVHRPHDFETVDGPQTQWLLGKTPADITGVRIDREAVIDGNIRYRAVRAGLDISYDYEA